MPKVQIKETYKYSQLDSSRNNYTVYIPTLGVVEKDAETNIEKRLYTKPTLYQSYGQLVAANYKTVIVDEESVEKVVKYDDNNVNYLMARKYLEKGLPVVLEGVENIVKYTINNVEYKLSYIKDKIITVGQTETFYKKYYVIDSDDETYVNTNIYLNLDNKNLYNESDYDVPGNVVIGQVTKVLYGTYEIDVQAIKDKNTFNIRFLTLGSYVSDETDDLVKTIINIAKSRVDSIALIDHPQYMSDIIDTKYADISKYTAQVRTYFETLLSDQSNDTLKYSAGFTPWLNVWLNTKDGNIDSKEVAYSVPGSFGYLSAFVDAIKENPEWFAIAGTFRGKVKELIEPLYKYTGADVEVLQARATTGAVDLDGANDNIGIAINPIAQIIPFGYVIDGNRTLYDSSKDTETRVENGVMILTYNSFLNIRQLVCALAKRLINASNKYTFEPNSDITYINFKSELTDLLDKMKSGQGIRGYKITRLVTSAKARIKALVSIKPIEALEDFDLIIELDDSLEIVE